MTSDFLGKSHGINGCHGRMPALATGAFVEAAAVAARVTEFNKTNFALFSWCLGDKAKKLLGPGKLK